MEQGTSEPRWCEVCGDPIRPDNKVGICTTKPECKSERKRRAPRKSQARPHLEPTKFCEVCGVALRSDNQLGVCSGNGKPECRAVRNQRAYEQGKVRSEPIPQHPGGRYCDVCGCPIRGDNQVGVCGDPWKPECRKERKRRKAAGLVPERPPAVEAGGVFGKWTALETVPVETRYVLCRCECGTEKRILGWNLTHGRSRDCGCTCYLEGARKRFPDPYIAAGAAFGRLTVLEDVWRQQRGSARCICECGTEIVVANPQALKRGTTQSCGCLRRERNTTHGLSKHPLYSVWKGMLERCENPNADSYDTYSEHGVEVCEQWHDVAVFIADVEREIGLRPEGRHGSGMPIFTIDRINNDGHYEPGNVRWSTQSVQVLNQRKVRDLSRKIKAIVAERDAAIAKADEVIAERDTLAVEVERLTQLLASRPASTSPRQEGLMF